MFLGALGKPAIVFVPASCGSLYFGIEKATASVPVVHTVYAAVFGQAAGYSYALRRRGDTETQVVIWGGDGAFHDIGMDGFSHIAAQNYDVIAVCNDNQGYMNTGGQSSSGTPKGTTTRITPDGYEANAKNLMEIMAAHRIPYAASISAAFPEDLRRKVQKAKNITGMKFLHLFSSCVKWEHKAEEGIRLARMAVNCGAHPLYEVTNGEEWIINHSPSRRIPAKEYLATQGRFRNTDPIAFQADLDTRWNELVSHARGNRPTRVGGSDSSDPRRPVGFVRPAAVPEGPPPADRPTRPDSRRGTLAPSTRPRYHHWSDTTHPNRRIDMPLVLQPTDERLTWAGAYSLQVTDEWAMPWRLPFEKKGLFHEGFANAASTPAGVRITFESDTTDIVGSIVADGGVGYVDLSIDRELVATSASLENTESFSFAGLKPGKKIIELWLPQARWFRLKSLTLSDGATVEKHTDPRPKWITYGSSISHCGAAQSPAYTWPGVVARMGDYDHTNFGVGGQCHLDALVAMMMRDLPADFLSMCVGINIQGGSSLGLRTYASSIIGFVKLVREKHPTTPFAIMSPIVSPPRETTPNAVGLSLQDMRCETEAAVKALRDHGDENVHYVDGLDVFGPELATPALLPDDLHPSAEGYKLMGERFFEKVAKPVFGAK